MELDPIPSRKIATSLLGSPENTKEQAGSSYKWQILPWAAKIPELGAYPGPKAKIVGVQRGLARGPRNWLEEDWAPEKKTPEKKISGQAVSAMAQSISNMPQCRDSFWGATKQCSVGSSVWAGRP